MRGMYEEGKKAALRYLDIFGEAFDISEGVAKLALEASQPVLQRQGSHESRNSVPLQEICPVPQAVPPAQNAVRQGV